MKNSSWTKEEGERGAKPCVITVVPHEHTSLNHPRGCHSGEAGVGQRGVAGEKSEQEYDGE